MHYFFPTIPQSQHFGICPLCTFKGTFFLSVLSSSSDNECRPAKNRTKLSLYQRLDSIDVVEFEGTVSSPQVTFTDNNSNILSRTLQRVKYRFTRTILSNDSADSADSSVNIFPYSNTSDEEVSLLFISDVVHPCRSHRLVLEKEGKMEAFVKSASRGCLMASIDTCPRRLIDTHTLNLVEFSQNVIIPPYAILSHRWTEEVVYAEYLQPLPETKSKPGYLKIEAACRQARHDDIRYLWVDTCCIKQGDHADVAENIMSMYAYYQNAEVCYAYLVDVKTRYRDDVFGIIDERTPFAPLGQGSEWFHRGWTLQELIAPRTVIFFNRDWQVLTDKHELRDDIYQVTSIPPTILSGTQSMQDIDLLIRMSWSVGRNTTKQQDLAYCLQGLLGVVLEPDYNESYVASFNRLGKALLDANLDLRERLGFSEDWLQDPENQSLYWTIMTQLMSTMNETRYLGISRRAVLLHIVFQILTRMKNLSNNERNGFVVLLLFVWILCSPIIFFKSESGLGKRIFDILFLATIFGMIIICLVTRWPLRAVTFFMKRGPAISL